MPAIITVSLAVQLCVLLRISRNVRYLDGNRVLLPRHCLSPRGVAGCKCRGSWWTETGGHVPKAFASPRLHEREAQGGAGPRSLRLVPAHHHGGSSRAGASARCCDAACGMANGDASLWRYALQLPPWPRHQGQSHLQCTRDAWGNLSVGHGVPICVSLRSWAGTRGWRHRTCGTTSATTKWSLASLPRGKRLRSWL